MLAYLPDYYEQDEASQFICDKLKEMGCEVIFRPNSLLDIKDTLYTLDMHRNKLDPNDDLIVFFNPNMTVFKVAIMLHCLKDYPIFVFDNDDIFPIYDATNLTPINTTEALRKSVTLYKSDVQKVEDLEQRFAAMDVSKFHVG